MENKFLLLFSLSFAIFLNIVKAQSTINYTYNGHITVKQSTPLTELKNPFTGGFQQPQFSAIDFNLDGINDLLVFDRGTKMYYTFINDGIINTTSYTYAPQYIAKLPPCNNFCLTYDYNNDSRIDLYVEANGYIKQYRNTSSSTLSFASPDTLSDYNGFSIYSPASNIPSFNDIDNDGDMDILTFDPSGATVNLYKNFRVEQGLTNNEMKYKLVDECWGKFSMTFDLYLGFHCMGNATWPYGDDYKPPPLAPNGGSIHSGSTLLTLDIDSDGDYEAFLGDIFYNYLYFITNGKRDFNYPKDTMIAKDSLYPSIAQRMEVNYFPSAYFLDVDNDNKRDIIIAPNDASGSAKTKNQIYFYKNIGTDRKPIFNLVQKNFLQDGTIDLGSGEAPAFVDIDNDGDDDLFIATDLEYTDNFNYKDVIYYYKNTGTSQNPSFELIDTDFLKLSSKKYYGLKPCFGDLNGDGKKDLLLGETNGYLKYYINTSIGNTISFIENTTQFASFQDRNYTSPFLVDFNHDGKLDLFLGNYDGTISYFINTGTTTNPIFTKSVDSVGKICIRQVDEFRNFYGDAFSTPVVADLDMDGKFDLLIGGKYGLYLYNNIEGKLGDSLILVDTVVRFSKSQLATNKPIGLYATPAIAQLDSDSVLDIMLGNNGGGVSVFSTYDFKSKSGIYDHQNLFNKLNITPNPAMNEVTIEGFDDEIHSLFVYDMTGKEVILETVNKSRKATLDISQLQQGVYFITIFSKNGMTYYGKFIKI
jgi:hypothetical protein